MEIREKIGGIDDEYYGQFYTTPVPEPGTWALLAAGLMGLIARRRSRAH